LIHKRYDNLNADNDYPRCTHKAGDDVFAYENRR